MALEISNATFDAFVKFAETQQAAGKQKAVARIETADAKELGGIVNRTIKPASGDWVGIGQGRLASLKRANNITRDAFRKAVADMFGGESHIPENVRDAMKLEDYGKGKPLTARRILAVKAAIESSGFLEQKALEVSMEKAALDKGYTKDEIPRLAKAVNLYMRTANCSEADALEAVSTPGSKANRLMNYGGRFLLGVDNFKNGLRLLDTFSSWFDETGAKLKSISDTGFKDGMSKTLLNCWDSVFVDKSKLPVERFVFEELANNPAADFAETDANKLFGVENNHAMSCIGRNFQSSRAQTFAQVPPEKRAVFFKALCFVKPIYASTAREARVPAASRGAILNRMLDIPIARILKNLDGLVSLEAQGKLTAANFTKLCFPEIPKPGAKPDKDILALAKKWDDDMDSTGNGKYPAKHVSAMDEAMKATGCSIEDALLIAEGKKQLPNVPYFSSGTLPLEDLDGTPRAARAQLEGDLHRAENYNYVGKPGILQNLSFKFNLPGGEIIETNGSEKGRANIPRVIEKLEALCGKVHPKQASSLMMMTSQSGMAPIHGGLSSYGIKSTEHSVVDFTISKNDGTGDVTVLYTSPKELPFKFEWSATIKLDGSVSTTPMHFMSEQDCRNAELVGPKALAAGYHKSEITMLANAFGFIKSATGCGEAEALEKTLDPTSRERRLFGYGGRFIASAEAFKQGLVLMDKFGGWYKNVVDEVKKNKNNLGGVPDPTVRNAYYSYLDHGMLKAYEKFLFEEIAANDSLPLGADNPDAVFGMEANPAMRFVGRGYTNSINDSVTKMPVEVRQVLFAAFDAMVPLAADEAGLRENPSSSGVTIPVARVMRHLDSLREMQKAGKFTAQNVKTLLFPDVPGAGTKSLKTILGEIEQKTTAKHMQDPGALMRIFTLLQSSGCTCDEVIAANNEGRILPSAPYILSGTGKLEDLDGTARGARKQAVGDLIRPSNPESIQNGAKMLPREFQVFTVRFPDGAVLTAGSSDNDADNAKPANAIADKVTEFVGEKHQAQLASVMIGLTQSAHGPFLDNAAKLGFVTRVGAEHSALTYTFSRNDETGAVTIRYSEPQGFPKKFHWETTIALDGSAVTSPLVVDE